MAAGHTLSLFDDAPLGGWQQPPQAPAPKRSALELLRLHLAQRRAAADQGQPAAQDGLTSLLRRAARAPGRDDPADLEDELAKAAQALDRGEFCLLVGDHALLCAADEAPAPEGCEVRLIQLLPLLAG